MENHGEAARILKTLPLTQGYKRGRKELGGLLRLPCPTEQELG